MWQPGNPGSKQNTNYWCYLIYFYANTNNDCDYDDNNLKKKTKTDKPANVSWLL